MTVLEDTCTVTVFWEKAPPQIALLDGKQKRYRQSQRKRYRRKARMKAAIAKYISAPRIPQPMEE
jgi:hypothetical protein